MMQSGYKISDLVQEAQSRWLKPAEVLFILQNHESDQLTHEPPQRPASGSLFLFNKRILRFFRKDGHSWRRKKNGRTVGEAHERLKVGNVEALNCYYAHGEQNPNFQRRSYWMLDLAYEHIVLVHYRDISELSPGLSGGSLSTPSPSSYTTQHQSSVSVISEVHEPYHNSSSPGSVEISSHGVVNSNGLNQLDMKESAGEVNSLLKQEFGQALRKLEEQLSLNDDSLQDIVPFYSENENLNESEYAVQDQIYVKASGLQDNLRNIVLQPYSADIKELSHTQLGDGFTFGYKEESTWKNIYASDGNGLLPSPSFRDPGEDKNLHWITSGGNNAQDSSLLWPEEVKSATFPSVSMYGITSDYYTAVFDQDQIGLPFEAGSSLTLAQKQKFTIREISPEWGYSYEETKVIIVGTFLCDSTDCPWTCMFGDIEVPLQIIQEGVVCCQAPPHLPGKVTLCITSGNRESCSEVREFEYCVKPSSSCAIDNLPGTEVSRSPEELLLLVRFVQTLLSDPVVQKREIYDSGNDLFGKFKSCEDSWSQVIESILVGNGTSSSTTDWLLQELLKDKLQQWLPSRLLQGNDEQDCSLSKKEQGIIHMIAGLGFEWALNPILNSGVSVNFRDINGWTALHWAARFGREKMVAALIASGASAGAVTDPNSQDPTGQTAASVAASCGHKGLAGYLSELALTSHLSSLTLEESVLSKGSADVEAERTVNSISGQNLTINEDHLSLKDTLAAVRNAAHAAAHIQSAFRAHSFRRRQQRKASKTAATGDEYSILLDDAEGLSAASKLAFGKARDYNSAALSIQKNYRGWKGRKDFLAFRQKVVKIQAHVRGHQVRKQYKVCWAVGVLEKVVLRWRRRGVGLRGFRQELESIDESEDEDILKVFRKQKVDAAIDEAVSRVLSMVDSQEARQQYRRMLEKYRQAKAKLTGSETEAASPFHDSS